MSSTFSTPRHFANAIRRARRLAVRTSTISLPAAVGVNETRSTKVENKMASSKRSRDDEDENETDLSLKRPCAHFSETVNQISKTHVLGEYAFQKNQPDLFHYSAASKLQPAVSPAQNLVNNSTQPVSIDQSLLLRLLLASSTSPQPANINQGGGLFSAAFLQGAAWAAAMCQKPAFPSADAPMLFPAFSSSTLPIHMMSSFTQTGVRPSNLPISTLSWPVAVAL